jgi:hypothetical protein
MLHTCVERFDVMGGIGNILGWEEEVNKAIITIPQDNSLFPFLGLFFLEKSGMLLRYVLAVVCGGKRVQ